jgi:hypothetical protein
VVNNKNYWNSCNLIARKSGNTEENVLCISIGVGKEKTGLRLCYKSLNVNRTFIKIDNTWSRT